jgi:hypothetical protein
MPLHRSSALPLSPYALRVHQLTAHLPVQSGDVLTVDPGRTPQVGDLVAVRSATPETAKFGATTLHQWPANRRARARLLRCGTVGVVVIWHKAVPPIRPDAGERRSRDNKKPRR